MEGLLLPKANREKGQLLNVTFLSRQSSPTKTQRNYFNRKERKVVRKACKATSRTLRVFYFADFAVDFLTFLCFLQALVDGPSLSGKFYYMDNKLSSFFTAFFISIPFPSTFLKRSPSRAMRAGAFCIVKSFICNPFFTSSQCRGIETVAPGLGLNE